MNYGAWVRGHIIKDWILYTTSFKIKDIPCDTKWGSIYATENMSLTLKFYFNPSENEGGFYRSGGSYRSADGNGWLMTNQYGNQVTDGGFPNFQILRGTASTVSGVITLWMFAKPLI